MEYKLHVVSTYANYLNQGIQTTTQASNYLISD